eukprot:10488703-Karenia_brevis.AAC.1
MDDRLHEYVTFMRALHAIVIRVYAAAQDLKQSPQFKIVTPELATPTHVKYVPYAYHVPLTFQGLSLKVDSQLLQ